MINILSDFIAKQAKLLPSHQAVIFKTQEMTYDNLNKDVIAFGQGLLANDLKQDDRIACYLPKQIETIIAIFGPAYAGGVFVPINPALKTRQVTYILKDCNVRYLVTSPDRLMTLKDDLKHCPDLEMIIVTGEIPKDSVDLDVKLARYEDFIEDGRQCHRPRQERRNTDMAAILYTSGSTGMPKGVVLSHRNMIVGAESVAGYLNNTSDDRILSVLPLSFDAGLSQLTTGFSVGATVILMNYLLPRDVLRQAQIHNITGLTCVPPLLIQLVGLDWPESVVNSMRYVATTGGRMPVPITQKLQEILPHTDIYLMYGLTEAFRSTYLPPSEVGRIPHSIGKAIPNVEILVVRDDGTLCGVGEEGELVHLGPLVGMGYWNDAERTRERYRPAPNQQSSINPEIAVWSGDRVKYDKDGYLYFVGRRDEMIKTSGFRISPVEVEETIYGSGLVDQIAAIGVDHPEFGQAIWVVATALTNKGLDTEAIMNYCRAEMPSYMVPQKIIKWNNLPRNPNGKIDRKAILEHIKQE